MDFNRSIILDVKDKASRALEKVNRVSDKISRSIKAVELRTRRVRKANKSWENGIARVRKAYRSIEAILKRVVNLARKAVAPVAAIASAGLGGALVGVKNQSQNTAQDAARAESLGLELDIFRRMREFLVRASDGLIQGDEAVDILRDIRERQQEARQEISRGEDPRTSSQTAISGLRDLGIIDKVDASTAEFVDAFLSGLRDAQNGGFLGRELASDVGDILVTVASKSKKQIARIERDILATLPSINAEDVQNARNFNTAWANLRTTLQALLREILTPLTPVLERLVTSVQGKVKEFVDSGAGERFATAIERVANAVIDLLPSVEGVAENVAERIERINKFVNGGTVKPPTELIKRRDFVRESLLQTTSERRGKQDRLIDNRGLGTKTLSFFGLGSGLGLEDAKREVALLREREASMVEVLGKLNMAIDAKARQIAAVSVPSQINATSPKHINTNTGPEPIGP